jgi:uncharacterized membrane protein
MENLYRSSTMTKLFLRTLIFLLPALALAQSPSTSSTYQPATITAVKQYQPSQNSSLDSALSPDSLYEVTVKVGGTAYVVLTPSPSPSGTILYAVGRDVLVHIGDNTITWNDIMGQSHEVPIVSRTVIADTSKPQGR